ncbi:MAG: preprotein translocase subunit SecE [Burkholderiales bacterium]
MPNPTNTADRMLDKIKLAIAALIVVLGFWGYYWLSENALVLRVLSVFGGIVIGAVIGSFTEPGRQFVAFSRDAIAEVKKVVWPTRKETMQTTAAVFAFAVAMAVFLWVTDKGLEWALYDLILGWTKT